MALERSTVCGYMSFRVRNRPRSSGVTQANENHKQVAKLFVATSTFAAEEPRIQQVVF